MNTQKIALFGATACNDFGDYAMLINNIRLIHNLDKNVKFKVFSYNIDNTASNLENNLGDIIKEVNIEVVADLTKKFSFIEKVLNKLGKLVRKINFYKIKYWDKVWKESYRGKLNNINSSFIKDLSECDKVIFIGGGYIQNSWMLDNIKFMTEINCAYHLKKKIYFLGNTIGPIDKFENYVSKSMQFVSSIMVRDNSLFSKKNLIGMKYKNVIVKGPDDLLFIEKNNGEGIHYNNENYIVIEVMPWINRAKSGEKCILDSIVKFCDFITGTTNQNIIFINFYKNEIETENYISYISSMVGDKTRISKINSIDNIYFINDVYKNCNFSLSFRYHPVVLALANSKPCIGVITDDDGYYYSKFGGAISNMGLDIDKLTMKLDDLNIDNLINSYKKIINNFEINADKFAELKKIREDYIIDILNK